MFFHFKSFMEIFDVPLLIGANTCCSWIRLSDRKMSDHDDVYLVLNDDRPNDDRPKRSINSLKISPHSKSSQTCGELNLFTKFSEQENRTSLFSKVLLWAKLKPGCSFILFFWFMNRLISTSQQIKSVVRWFFPILQFNCGRDVSSQYFISTNARLSSFLAAVSFFWKEQRQQEVTNFAFDKRHFSANLLDRKRFCWKLTCNSTTAKANLVSCSFAGWSAALMNREILKKGKIVKCFLIL